MSKFLTIGLLLAAFIFGLVSALLFNDSGANSNTSSDTLALGSAQNNLAPIWHTQFDSNQDLTKLVDHQADYLVVDFWASWCKPCIRSLPFYHQTFEQLAKDKIQFVSINLDLNKQDAEQFLQQNQLDGLSVLFDPKGLSEQAFSISGLPTLLIFDRQRKLIQTKMGFKASQQQQLKSYFANLAK